MKPKICYRCYKRFDKLHVRDDRQLKICTACFEMHYLPLCKSKEEKRKTYKASIKRYKDNRRNIVKEHLLKNPCKDCGESNIVVLDFDHIEPANKKKDICTLISTGSTKQLLDEIGKCEVVCANCHRIRTAKTFGSWRLG